MKSLLKLLMVVCLSVCALGQNPNLPTVPHDDRGIDSVNLQNLSVEISVPIVSKTGAISYTYYLGGASNCWSVAYGVNNSQHAAECGLGLWKFYPAIGQTPWGNWFVQGESPITSEWGSNWAVSYTTRTNPSCGTQTTTKYSNLFLVSPAGDTYPFPSTDYVESGGCTHTLDDYTVIGGIHVTTSSAVALQIASLTFPSGFTAPGASIHDTFGNAIAYSSSTTSYTDTLGRIIDVTPSNPATGDPGTYFWSDTTGGQQHANEIVSPATIKTAFGCASVTDTSYAGGVISEIDYPDQDNLYFQYESVAGGVTGRLYQITLRTGGTITYGYGAINCTSMIPSSLSRTTDDGTTTYSFSVFNGTGTGTYGTTTTVLDPGKNKSVYTFMGTDSGGVQKFSTPLTLTQIQTYQNTGTVASPVYTLLSSTVYCYNGNSANCPTTQTSAYPITQRDIYNYVGSTSTSMSHVTQVFDSYGNVISSTTYDYITTQSPVTTATYSGCGQGAAILDHPCDIKTTVGSNTISETKFTYNPNGALTQKQNWTGSQWLTTNVSPNANGTVASTTSANGQVTSYGYANGCNNLLPTSLTTTVNGVVISLAQTWDCNAGLVLTTTDANGHTPSATQYDSMLRPSLVTDNLGNNVSILYDSNAVSTYPSFGASKATYLDGLGRPDLTQVTNPVGTYDTVSTLYGYSGANRQISTSSPCFQTPGQPCSIYNTALFDSLTRPISSTDALGGILTYTYTQNDASVTAGPAPSGEHVKTVQTEMDGLGRTKSICNLQTTGGTACGQAMGNSGIVTNYSYSFGPGTSTVTATRGVQTHTVTSDALGRVISTTTPDRGTVTNTYEYDSYCAGSATTGKGQIVRSDDSQGYTTCYYYEPAGRLSDIQNNAPSSVNVCKKFRYDSTANKVLAIPSGYVGTNIKGRLMEAETDDCAGNAVTDEWFAYDANGQVTDTWESTPHSGGYYHTTAAYYPNGVVSSISGIPGYTAYTFGVDSEGRPFNAQQGSTNIIGNLSTGTGVQYDAASKPTIAYIGTNSGDNDQFTYDALEQMKTYTFTVNGLSMGGTLTWDADGTLGSLAITDTFNAAGAQTCNYAYDDVARLTTNNCGTDGSWTYSYDQYDNMSKSGTTSWQPGYTASNNHMIGSTYDSRGIVQNDTVNNYIWDAYGKLYAVKTGGAPSCGTAGSSCVWYDAFGRIVETSNGGTYRELLYGPTGRLAQMAGQVTQNAYIPLPGGLGLFASGTGGTSRFIQHPDWLGTKRLSTSLGGRTQRFDTAYTPYGETYDTFGTLNQDFTGDLQDVFSGLFDTPNRELATNAARWLSPDPAGASWNAYSYPTNPNSSVDPSGLRPCNPGVCTSANNMGINGDFNDLEFSKVSYPAEQNGLIGSLMGDLQMLDRNWNLLNSNDTIWSGGDTGRNAEGMIVGGGLGDGRPPVIATAHWSDGGPSVFYKVTHPTGPTPTGMDMVEDIIGRAASLLGLGHSTTPCKIACAMGAKPSDGARSHGNMSDAYDDWKDLKGKGGTFNGDVNGNHFVRKLLTMSDPEYPEEMVLEQNARKALTGWMNGEGSIQQMIIRDPALREYMINLGSPYSDWGIETQFTEKWYQEFGLWWNR